MNMTRIRNILEMRRATKAAPLLPPKAKRQTDVDSKKQGPKEIIDIHVKIRDFRVKCGVSNTIMCLFSESDDGFVGPWKVSTTSEVLNKEANIDLLSVFALEFQFERSQYIKLDICDWSDNSVSSLGYTVFSVSELVVRDKGAIIKHLINDETGESVADVEISCTIRPKPHSVVLQFAAKNLSKKTMIPNTAQIFFEVQKQDEDTQQQTILYRSEVQKWSQKIVFRHFSLQSTDMTDTNVEFICYFRDSKNPRGLLGKFETNYELLKTGNSVDNTYFLSYVNSKRHRKTCGAFEMVRCNDVALSSFLDYISSGATLNFAVAIDFSRPDTFIDESFIRRYLQDVEVAVKSIGEPFRDFSVTSSYAAFGFGAKIPPHFRESQEFCLSLETDPYCRGLDGIIKAFKNSFANVQPITVAHLSHVIYYVSKLAQNALNRNQAMHPSYFVLAILTRGVFDDLKETIQAIIFASRAPISIVFVGMGDADLTELERLGTAGTRLNFHGRKPERDCIQYVSLPKCYEEESNPADLKSLIAERALSGVPWQMSTWMTKNGYKPKSAPVAYSQEVQHDQAFQAIPMQCTYRQPRAGQQAGSVFSTQTATTTHQAFVAVPLRQLPAEPRPSANDYNPGTPRASISSVRSTRSSVDGRMVKMTSQMSIDDRLPTHFQEGYYHGSSRPYVVQCVQSEVVPRYQAGYVDGDTVSAGLGSARRAPSSSSLLEEGTRSFSRHTPNLANLRSYSIQASTGSLLSPSSSRKKPEYINQ